MGAHELVTENDLIRYVCALVEKRIGVHLGERQFPMVQARLKRRMFELQLQDAGDYSDFLHSNPSECAMLVSLLTTHYTYFFREFVQFEHLEAILPSIVKNARDRGANRIDVLSAACSRGQEVYSLAMHLHKHLKQLAPGMGFRILGTDVDPESLKVAENGVYRHDEIKTVPLGYLENHWARGTKEISQFVKAKKSLRENCDFAAVNLLDMRGLEGRKFDLIFCRNVFIYFTAKQVKDAAIALGRHLHPGGMFFIGLTESLQGFESPWRLHGPSIYCKEEAQSPNRSASAPVAQRMPNPLRVVCIDDSSSIITLLQYILTKEDGFEVVGTAKNGEEGKRLIQQLKPDVITLDIHMPVCDGIQFLRDAGPERPPVVMVSSVSRDDAGLAFEALQLGASDYVEKPTLNNMEQRADELKAKLRAAYRGKNSPSVISQMDREFKVAPVISHPERCARIMLFSLAEQAKCASLVREFKESRVPLFLAIEGVDSILPEISERLSRETGMAVGLWTEGEKIVAGSAFVGGWHALVKAAATQRFERISVLVLGDASAHAAKALPSLSGAQLLLEDLGEGKGATSFRDLASDVVPPTSFAYLSSEFLAGPRKGF